MRRTFCDGCGTECVNTVVHLHGAIQHQTSQGEQVGYDDIKPVELCPACFEPIKQQFGLIIRPQEMDTAEMAMARPVPPPLMASEVPG